MIKHCFNFINQNIELSWSVPQKLFQYLLIQRTTGFQAWQNTLDWFSDTTLNSIDRSAPISIIDVGSGVGILSLILSQFYPNSLLYLVDQEGWVKNNPNNKKLIRSPDHPIYNHWGPLHDAIETMNLDPRRFNILDKTSCWPRADVIVSTFSWCWHYPLATYLSNLLTAQSLKTKLLLTVSNWPEQNISILDQYFRHSNKIHSIKLNEKTRYPEEYIIDQHGHAGHFWEWFNE